MGLADFSSRSTDVSLQRLTKIFKSMDGSGEVVAVNDISLDIKTGELVTILGPSGCGKTTTLRMVAGFEFPTAGSILIGGKDVAPVPPNKRGISMVFQSYALFPHLNIYENIAYGLRVQKLPASEIAGRTRAILELMQLTSMQRRYPSQVSGGQQQRIALARAIVIEPSVLLFDEPLSNLDAKLREYMRDELRKLQKRLGITSLYVTHDQEEAMAISDRIVIMQDGVIRQVGSPRAIYEHPESIFVATFMGKANILPAEILGRDGEAALVDLAGSRLKIPNPGHAAPKAGKGNLVVRPEAVKIVHVESADASLKGKIERMTYFGNIARYEIPVLGTTILAERYNPQGARLHEEGETVGVSFEMDSVRILKE
ncbi:MAG: iron(III) transport system ATP-binding protein [Spirochaetes bacterium]|nr:MAG: iron(III) transport system ATP-binding protein [Spirochaetota bacterium]